MVDLKLITFFLVALVCFLIPGVAFAAPVTSSLLPFGGEILAMIVSAVVLPVIGWLGKKLASYLDGKIENDMMRSALGKLNTVAFSVVADLSQQLADKFKEASADGKLTDEEKDQLKDLAVSQVKKLLSLKTWGVLTDEFGEEGAGDLVASQIEAAVRANKSPTLNIKPGAPKLFLKEDVEEGKP